MFSDVMRTAVYQVRSASCPPGSERMFSRLVTIRQNTGTVKARHQETPTCYEPQVRIATPPLTSLEHRLLYKI